MCSFYPGSSICLRAARTLVTAHTLCASGDTRVFLWVVPTNTGIVLRGLKLCRESRTHQVLLVSKMKIGGDHAFFRDNKASVWKKRHTLLCILRLFRIIVA